MQKAFSNILIILNIFIAMDIKDNFAAGDLTQLYSIKLVS